MKVLAMEIMRGCVFFISLWLVLLCLWNIRHAHLGSAGTPTLCVSPLALPGCKLLVMLLDLILSVFPRWGPHLVEGDSGEHLPSPVLVKVNVHP